MGMGPTPHLDYMGTRQIDYTHTEHNITDSIYNTCVKLTGSLLCMWRLAAYTNMLSLMLVGHTK